MTELNRCTATLEIWRDGAAESVQCDKFNDDHAGHTGTSYVGRFTITWRGSTAQITETERSGGGYERQSVTWAEPGTLPTVVKVPDPSRLMYVTGRRADGAMVKVELSDDDVKAHLRGEPLPVALGGFVRPTGPGYDYHIEDDDVSTAELVADGLIAEFKRQHADNLSPYTNSFDGDPVAWTQTEDDAEAEVARVMLNQAAQPGTVVGGPSFDPETQRVPFVMGDGDDGPRPVVEPAGPRAVKSTDFPGPDGEPIARVTPPTADLSPPIRMEHVIDGHRIVNGREVKP